MTRRARLAEALASAIVIACLTVACGEPRDDTGAGGSEDQSPAEFSTPFENAEAYPVFISSEVVVGENRFLLGLLDENDAPIGRPSIDVTVSFFDLERSAENSVATKDMDFIWSSPGERGVYVTHAEFDRAGEWGAEVSISGDGIDESVKGTFKVAEEPSTPGIGESVPPSDTPTVDDVGDLSEISSDPHPDPRFYESSIAEAVDAGKPFVVTFATPKFCTSRVCGPTLDIVKSVAEDFPNVNFIHVEVYSNLDDPSNLKTVPSVEEWGLPTEPWVFVVDGSGDMFAKFEGVVGAEELSKALSSL